jgi:predicted transcriptional regulator
MKFAIEGRATLFQPRALQRSLDVGDHIVPICTQQNTTLGKAMSSTTVSVRIDPVIKDRLEKLAKSTGRSRSFLAAEAITEYVNSNEWQVAGIHKAVVSLDRGQGVAHERVKEWVSSWGSKQGRPAPKRTAT